MKHHKTNEDYATWWDYPPHTYCGGCSWRRGVPTSHDGPCPRIVATEFYPDGSVKSVEFEDHPIYRSVHGVV